MDFIESKGKTVDEAVFSGLVKMDLSIDEVDIEILDEGGGFFKSARVRLTKKPEDKVTPFVPEKPLGEEFSRPRRDDRREERRGGDRRDNDRGERRGTNRYDRDRQDAGRSGDSRRGGGDYRNDGRSGGGRRDDRRGDGHRDERRRSELGIPADFVAQEPTNDAEKFLLGLFSRMNMGVVIKSATEDGILKLDLSGRGMGVLIGRRGETLDALQYLTSLVVNNGKADYTKIMLDTEDYRKKREDTLKHLAARLADKVQKSGKRVVLEPMNPYERRILHATLQDYDNVYTYSEGEDPFRSVVVALKGDEPGPEAAETARRSKE
jgi:spoIIIJ-associated protein